MSSERDRDIQALLRAVGGEAPEAAPPTEFALSLGKAFEQAVLSMRRDGVLEMEDASVPGLVAELTDAGLDAHSPKHMLRRLVKTLIKSDHVEEVYATDEELTASLRQVIGTD